MKVISENEFTERSKSLKVSLSFECLYNYNSLLSSQLFEGAFTLKLEALVSLHRPDLSVMVKRSS